MGDDGFGLAVLEALRDRNLPREVKLLDGGTGGLSLLHIWEGAGRVILIDAAEMGRPPGTLRRLTQEELKSLAGATVCLSLHSAGLPQVLAVGHELGMLPECLELFVVQACTLAVGTGLSPLVEKAVGTVADLILASLVGPGKTLEQD